ncbi:serine/threonine-protein kinase 12 isoform X1 [Coffea arabica]|uniref:Serine/threonine-protein kinase 12 isoform X1 n=1 Tax=Coffea arabica TaxID=13443 RepID=A0ABM4WZM8_COFAR
MEYHKSQLLKQTRRIDSESPYRLLHCSSKGDKKGVVQELEKGVEPTLADYDKRTALHLASCEGYIEVVVLLLERGADVNSTDRWGRTPLSDARSFGHADICKILEKHGGIDPVALDSQMRGYEIEYTEVDMTEAPLLGECYKIIKRKKQGAYGEVYLVKWRGTEVAAKTIRSSIASNETVKKTFLKELALWQKLRHPNIVQFLGVVKHSDRLTFLTEYLQNGSLYDILRKKGRLDPPTAVAYALDIARGMNYLHQHKPHPIIHRDLTPRNILQNEARHLKVTDFGLSKIVQEKNALGYKMTGETGSYRYMAPEVYRRETYGISVDVFSFALVVHEMFQGGPSSREEAPEEVADKRAYEDLRPPLSSFVYPEPIRRLLRDCWHKNPDCRPTFEEIILQLEIIQENMQGGKPLGSCYECVIL